MSDHQSAEFRCIPMVEGDKSRNGQVDAFAAKYIEKSKSREPTGTAEITCDRLYGDIATMHAAGEHYGPTHPCWGMISTAENILAGRGFGPYKSEDEARAAIAKCVEKLKR